MAVRSRTSFRSSRVDPEFATSRRGGAPVSTCATSGRHRVGHQPLPRRRVRSARGDRHRRHRQGDGRARCSPAGTGRRSRRSPAAPRSRATTGRRSCAARAGAGFAPSLGRARCQRAAGVPVMLGGLVAGRAVEQTGLGGFVAQCALVPVLASRTARAARLSACAWSCRCGRSGCSGTGRRAIPTRHAYVRRLLFDRDESDESDESSA